MSSNAFRFGRCGNWPAALILVLWGLTAVACAQVGEQPLSRMVSGPLQVSPTPQAVVLDPPLQPQRRVQYVALGVPDAPRWRSGGAPGLVVDPAGRPVRIEVVLERADGQRVVLNEVSFGRALMYSHLPAIRAAGGSDLPHTDRYTRLWLSATPALDVRDVRWLDITNP